MQPYANRSGTSAVVGYQTDVASITVEFNDGSVYVYTNASAGPANIEQMKRLALSGQGLNTFINRVVRKSYARKLR